MVSPKKTSHVQVNLKKSRGLLDKRKYTQIQVAGKWKC